MQYRFRGIEFLRIFGLGECQVQQGQALDTIGKLIAMLDRPGRSNSARMRRSSSLSCQLQLAHCIIKLHDRQGFHERVAPVEDWSCTMALI